MSRKTVWIVILMSVSFVIAAVPLSAQGIAHVPVPRETPTFTGILFQPKFVTMFLLAIFAVLLLYTRRMGEKTRVALLLFATFAFGIAGNLPGRFFHAYAMHPSPVCAATKPFLFGLRLPFIVTIAVIGILTLIGPKLFCSYICPVGAMQELAARVSRKFRFRMFLLNPSVTLLTRMVVFALFIALSVTAYLHVTFKGHVYPVSLYDYINPFHGFEFDGKLPLTEIFFNFVPLFLTIILAFKWYRPFCYAVCPVGLFTHWLEQAGALRVTFVPDKCTRCNLCVTETACPAVPEILKEAAYRPDCFACNQCISACPAGALKWGTRRSAAQTPNVKC